MIKMLYEVKLSHKLSLF